MEYEQDENTNSKSFAERIKESPRTVSALIIILIVAAAIYAFSDNPEQQPTELASNNETASEETEEASEANNEQAAETQEQAEEAQQEEQVSAPAPVSKETLTQQSQSLAQGEKTDSAYVETAQAGEGFTHIARRATTRYLSENDVQYEVTNEHRIYIEDYIQNRLGTRGLEVGEQHTVSFDLMREAVAAAANLTPQQLNNLTQYTSALS